MMKQFIKEFLKRGAFFCSLGPVIVAIIYIFLLNFGVVETVHVRKIIVEIFSSTIMAFVAAGVSAVYTVDKLQTPTAALIQGSVLLIDYLSVYLLNGWLETSVTAIAVFIGVFIFFFLLIWLFIYFFQKAKIKKLNSKISLKE